VHYNDKISYETFIELYGTTKYRREEPDVKRNNALETLTQAAPQTHTHGEKAFKPLKLK
jgi:trehalose utilization protein